MITVKIEKEIDIKNKIFLGLNMRQLIVTTILSICSVLIKTVIKPPQGGFMFICTLFGVIDYYLAFKKYEDFPPEYFIIKKFKTSIWANEKRVQRTKNKYITMLNRAYKKDMMDDLKDKSVKKKMKKDQKASKKAHKKDHLEFYY